MRSELIYEKNSALLQEWRLRLPTAEDYQSHLTIYIQQRFFTFFFCHFEWKIKVSGFRPPSPNQLSPTGNLY
jgi:hypothetical protein